MILTVLEASEELATMVHGEPGDDLPSQMRYVACVEDITGLLVRAIQSGKIRPRNRINGRYDDALAFMGKQASISLDDAIEHLNNEGMQLSAPSSGTPAMTNANKTVGLEHCLTPEGINPIAAALVRKGIATGTEEEFEAAFGMPKSAAASALSAWELLRLPEWDADVLLAAIPENLWPNRAAVLRHIRSSLPQTFAPMTGIEWAESNQYMPCGWVFRTWAEKMKPTDEVSKAGDVSNARPGVPSREIIEGFSLEGKDWGDLLSHPNSDGKRFKPALVQAGKQGKGGAALWSPVIFARLLIEQNELNKGQVVSRFKKAWPPLVDEMLAEIGEF